ncbi:MAG: hypothetical protein ABFS22_03195 [Pseudomonadota bacterium]
MKRILLLPVTSTLVVLLGAGLLLLSNLYTFYRLTDESPIAELRFVSRAPGEYQALLLYGDFCEPQRYTLYGDQWRLDAMFLKWRSWANLLGMDSLYRIERLGGRYRGVSAENAATAHAYELQADSPVDLAGMLARYKGVISPVDTLYGSSVYADMDPAFIYQVYRGQSGLLVRKVPAADSPASDGTLTIDINRSCGGSPGLLERAGGYANRLVRRISG